MSEGKGLGWGQVFSVRVNERADGVLRVTWVVTVVKLKICMVRRLRRRTELEPVSWYLLQRLLGWSLAEIARLHKLAVPLTQRCISDDTPARLVLEPTEVASRT
jgi:hypothetical protein